MLKKKIIFFVLNIYQTGGIERVVTEISNCLCEDYDITILSLFKTNDFPYFNLKKEIKVANVLNKEMNIRRHFFYIKNRIKKVIKKNDFDIFVNSGMGYVPLTIFAKNKGKYIAWEHSNCNIGKKYGLTWFGRKLSSKYADAVIFLTKKDLKNFCKRIKCNDNNKLIQIYNPSAFNLCNHKYNKDSKKIISCGRLCYQKGFDMLIKVAKIVFSNSNSDGWTWDIYGDGPLHSILEKSIIKENLQNNVILKGNVNNINELYQEYAFFVLTSRYEGFCMVNIEASFNKLPIVSFNCDCGPDEIIDDGVNGFIIDNFDIEQMANCVLRLISDKGLRQKFSNNTALDKEKLEMDNIIKKWKDLLNRVGE